jgi:hypothetical protein
LGELEHAFRFNDAVMRHLVIKMKRAEIAPSPMIKQIQREESRKAAAEAVAPAQDGGYRGGYGDRADRGGYGDRPDRGDRGYGDRNQASE